uniref:Reverse transcriptase zinc-binding domain-containing protein n=1 Tax=Oryza brachyantha TaxID=4533 RepID=J3M6C1_ORYBR
MKGITQSSACAICDQQQETATHILLMCPFAISFWNILQINPGINHLENWHCIKRPSVLPKKTYRVFISLCLWTLWIHRNSVIFDNKEPCLRRAALSGLQEIALWVQRLKNEDIQSATTTWKMCFRDALLRSLLNFFVSSFCSDCLLLLVFLYFNPSLLIYYPFRWGSSLPPPPGDRFQKKKMFPLFRFFLL